MIATATVYRLNKDVSIEAAEFSAEKPVKWAVRQGRLVMSKKTGEFVYEPFPSSRTEEFLSEHRLDSPEEAESVFYEFYEYEKVN